MSECYVSEHGLPRAVATYDDLPAVAFVGYLCYVKESDSIYYYNGEEYDVVIGAAASAYSMDGGEVVVTVYTGKSSFPSDATTGQLAFSTNASSKGLYVYTGSSWEKLALSTEAASDAS